MAILLDLDSYPFILQGFPRGAKTEAEIGALFDEMAIVGRRAVESGALHVVIALGDENFTAAERRIIAHRMARAPADQAARVVGAFAVIESAIARGVLTALRWLAPRVIPVVAAATPDEAIDLAEKCLDAQGVIPALAIIERARIRARRLHAEMRSAPETGTSPQ
jgi:hypothetical protein